MEPPQKQQVGKAETRRSGSYPSSQGLLIPLHPHTDLHSINFCRDRHIVGMQFGVLPCQAKTILSPFLSTGIDTSLPPYCSRSARLPQYREGCEGFWVRASAFLPTSFHAQGARY